MMHYFDFDRELRVGDRAVCGFVTRTGLTPVSVTEVCPRCLAWMRRNPIDIDPDSCPVVEGEVVGTQ